MKKTLITVTLAVLLLAPLPLLAQEEEDEYDFSPLAFQGRVGFDYSGGEPFKNGATFEVNTLVRMNGPIYFNVAGGIMNFNSEGDVMPISDEFQQTWRSLQDQITIRSLDNSKYKLNYVTAGLAVVLKTGKFEPVFTGGIGAYYSKFVTSFSYLENALIAGGLPEDQYDAFASFLSLSDSKWLMGYNFGAGLYYEFNPIISFGGQATYHILDTEALENQLTVSFGLHIKVPD